ncbi:MAG: PP2C family protein-serine/threonine phosphatase [Terracidiphilus sp.]
MKTFNPWQTTPRKTSVIFLLAVFFVFASFGFTSDGINMGNQAPLPFALSVVLVALFAICYTVAGISLRGQFWKAMLPIFAVQFICMGLVGHWFPSAPLPIQMDAAETARLHGRLTFDGLAAIISICLGYSGLVYVSISESRRHIRAQTEKAALESEMAAAREVQRVMVPDELPQIDGYSIESVYRPAAEVGGDFFQVIPLKSGRTLVVIGDVSGKGLRAAMIVSMIVGTLRTVSGYTEEPAEILGELNRRLCGHMQEGFATCLAVRLEDNGKLTMANAGHLPPYVNGIEARLDGALPLGLVETADYEQTSLSMAEGDGIVMMTDGIAEAHDSQHVLLGFPRVEAMLREGATAKNVVEAAQQYGQDDDITVLRVSRLS